MTGHVYDAVIIGAGVAGSTAAILLAQAGWSVALVEKRSFPRRKVCGECIAASNLPLLDALGVGEAFDQRAGPQLRRVGLFAGEHRFIAALPRFQHPTHGWGRALGREHLDTLLRDRAAVLGATIWQPWCVREVTRHSSAHRMHLSSHDSEANVVLDAPVLIDAHGSWELAPNGIGGLEGRTRPKPRHSDLFAFKGNFTDADLEAGLLPVLAFTGGYGGMVLADDGQLTLACCIRRDRLKALRALAPGSKAAAAVQAHLQASCAGVRYALAGALSQGTWLSAGPMRPGLRAPAPAPNVFAIGNAAGEAHPILGEGISMAMQSAFLLCAELAPRRADIAAGRESERVAHAYTKAWRRHFAPRIRTAALLSHLAMRPGAAGALVPLLRRWPVILTAAARLGGKVRSAVDPQAMMALR